MDLALAMIEADLGRNLALAIARRHVVFRIRPGGQSQFSAELAAQSAGNTKLQKLAKRVAAHPRMDWRTDVMAVEIGVSQRSLSRLFRASLNTSPADFVERVRIDLARRKLLDTDENVETIADACGFGSLRRMDRAFARTISASPTEFRSRFKTHGGQACPSLTSALSKRSGPSQVTALRHTSPMNGGTTAVIGSAIRKSLPKPIGRTART
jgi:transcriptional regulator GlxA family with amidase domain